MNRERLSTINKVLVIILILIQPLVCILREYVANDIQIFGFSFYEVFNILLVVSSLLITIFLYREKKHFKKFLIIIPFFIIYCILHYLNMRHFNLAVYENATPDFLRESYYLFRMFMVPLLLIISLYYSGIKKDSCIRIVETYSFIISTIIVVTNIFLIAQPSYGSAPHITKNIFDWFTFKSNGFYDYYELASVGLFGSANKISAALFMTCPIIMYQAYRKKSIYNYFLLIVHSVAMLMVGTKTANLGVMLIYLSFIALFIFLRVQKNTHHSIKPILVIFAFVLALFCFSPISQNIRSRLSGSSALSAIEKEEKSYLNETVEQKKLRKGALALFNEIRDKYDCNNLTLSENINVQLLLSSKYIHFLGISEYIPNNYSVSRHVKFWCEYVKDFDGNNYRNLKTKIYHNIYTDNNNKMDKWFGMGHTINMIYTEADYSFQFYSYGIIGIIILLGPYFATISYLIFKFLKDYKKNFNIENVMYLLGIIVAVIAAYFSGHVFETSITLLCLSLLIGLNLINFHDKTVYKKKVMFISSTGGHFNELSQLKSIYDDYDYRVVTEKTKSTVGLKKKYGRKVKFLVFGTKDHRLSYPFKFAYNCIKSLYIFLTFNPKVIVTTGTHTAVPMCYIGKFFGCKIIFIETFANSKTKTLAGRMIYPIADEFIVQWESMLELYPKAKCFGWIY